MAVEPELMGRLRARLDRDPRAALKRNGIWLSEDGDRVVLNGDVQSVASKRASVELAAEVMGVSRVVDRLHVLPARRMPDPELLSYAADALVCESGLADCAIALYRDQQRSWMRPPSTRTRGEIELRVREGVLTLEGTVAHLAQKRIAELLAWWLPGTRDVLNMISVAPGEADSDDELSKALDTVFHRDPLLETTGVYGLVRAHFVTLIGVVHSEGQKRAAEDDAWSLFGVSGVDNRIRVRF